MNDYTTYTFTDFTRRFKSLHNRSLLRKCSREGRNQIDVAIHFERPHTPARRGSLSTGVGEGAPRYAYLAPLVRPTPPLPASSSLPAALDPERYALRPSLSKAFCPDRPAHLPLFGQSCLRPPLAPN